MKFFNKLSFLYLFVGLLLASCDRSNLDETIVPDPGFEPEVVVVNNMVNALAATNEDGYDLGCFSIDYPFELILENGSTIEVFTDEELEAALNQESPYQVVNFVFPLTVTTEDGENVEVNNGEELGMMFASCIPDEGWDDTSTGNGNIAIPAFLFEGLCFDLVYPVNLNDGEGNTYVAISELALVDLIITVPDLAFTLPLTVTNEDGEEVVIESVAGFYSLYYSCDGNEPPSTEGGISIDFDQLSGECNFEDLSIQFPYNILTEDGELITVADENQEAALILSGVHYSLEYPFNLVDGGDVITINNELQFIELILPCLITVEPTELCDTPSHILLYFNQTCGVVNYPNQLAAGGNVYTINSMNDYFTVYNQYNWDEISIIYPISVTDSDGTVSTFNSNQEVCTFIEDCF